MRARAWFVAVAWAVTLGFASLAWTQTEPPCTSEDYIAVDEFGHLATNYDELGPFWLFRQRPAQEKLSVGNIEWVGGEPKWVRRISDTADPGFGNVYDMSALPSVGEGWLGLALQASRHGYNDSSSGLAQDWTTGTGFNPDLPISNATISTGFAQVYGSRLNQALLTAPGPGTFLNPAKTIGESSFALVPSGDEDVETSWNGIKRETIGGIVDLATGSPLHSFQDLALPFGGTEFRLTRTRSSYATAPGSRVHHAPEVDAWWDWAGAGWMVSENPLLVIDSAAAGAVGNGPRTTWFIPDAHHAIPFQQIESTGKYEAPPRFRARLEHNGTGWGPLYDIDGNGQLDVRGWTSPPTWYRVLLYEGALTYTFAVVREDVPSVLFEPSFAEFGPTSSQAVVDQPLLSSLHHRPYLRQQFEEAGLGSNGRDSWHPYLHNSQHFGPQHGSTADGLQAVSSNPGLGVPYYGLCAAIEDRRGHRARIEYFDAETRLARPGDNLTEVFEASQNKGRIRRVILEHADPATSGQYNTDWTLLYSYRSFVGSGSIEYDGNSTPQITDRQEAIFDFPLSSRTPEEQAFVCSVAEEQEGLDFVANEPEDSDFWTRQGFSAIDRIYVFEGEAAGTESIELSLPHTDKYVLSDGTMSPDGGSDALLEANQALWNQWRYQVRYHYAHITDPGDDQGLPEVLPVLVKSTVQQRDAETLGGPREIDRRLFHYRHEGFGPLADASVNGAGFATSRGTNVSYLGMPWLFGIWDSESVAEIIQDPNIPVSSVDELFYWKRSGTTAYFHQQSFLFDQAYPGTNVTVLDAIKNKAQFWSTNLRYGDNVAYNWPQSSSATDEASLYYGTMNLSPTDDGKPYAPNAMALLEGGYLLQDRERLFAADTYSFDREARAVSYRDESDTVRHVRIHRLVHGVRGPSLPMSSQESIGECHALGLSTGDVVAGLGDFAWDRSAYLHPFPWRAGHERTPNSLSGIGGEDNAHEDLLSKSGELSEARWISIVEEFDSREEMLDRDTDYVGADSVKPGQLNRRIVELNPAGYMLRDRTWRYLPSGTVEQGAGLGEEFVYQSVGSYFNGTGKIPASTESAGETGGPAGTGTSAANEIDLISNDLLLLERRTVNWSAGKYTGTPTFDTEESNLNADRFTNGMVEFYEYDVIGTNPVPWTERVQLTARGIKRGQAYERGWELANGSERWESTGARPSYTDTERFLVRPYGVGASGNPPRLYTQQYFRDDERPSSVTSHVHFLDPATSLLTQEPAPAVDPGAGNETFSVEQYVELYDPSNPDAPSSVIQIDSGVRPGPDQPLHYAVRREIYNEDGSLRFSAEAFLPGACFSQSLDGILIDPALATTTGPSGPDYPHAALTLTYYLKDDQGRTIASVMDAGPGTDFDHRSEMGGLVENVTIPVLPSNYGNWSPFGGAGGAPLNYVTSFVYDPQTELLSDMYTHDGTRWSSRYVKIDPTPNDNDDSDAYLREYVFDGLVATGGTFELPSGESIDEYVAKKAGEVRDYPVGALKPGEARPVTVRKGVYVVDSSADELVALVVRPDELDLEEGAAFAPDVTCDLMGDCPSPEFRVFAVARGEPDANGRIQNATLLEPDATGALRAVGTKEINDLGAIFRENEIDGTITRLTRNPLGHVLRQYTGTTDNDWLDVEPVYGGGPWNPPADPDYNMALIGRTEYGTGVDDLGEYTHDAWMPTITRRYYDNPAWSIDHHGEPDPNGNDEPSYASRTSYDWRQRAVRTDHYDGSSPGTSPRLSTTLRYFDHVDRLVMEVEFGEGALSLPAGVDPLGLYDDDALPTPADLLILSLTPRSVREMVYGVGTNAVEVREYDVLSGVSAQYLSTLSYQGRGGETVFQQSPSSPVMLRLLDGLGRVSKELSGVPGTGSGGVSLQELSRTEYTYDGSGNVVESSTWERVVDVASSADELDVTNAVRTRVVSWFDAQRRLIATADLGTELDAFTAGTPSQPFVYNGAAPPTWDPATPGTVNRSGLPDQARLRINKYNVLTGELDYEVDPAGVVSHYEYSDAGRLESVTVNPWLETTTQPISHESTQTRYGYKWGRKVLTATDRRGRVDTTADDQVTVVKYGADIVNDQFQVVSRNNSYIGEVRISRSDDEIDWFLRYDQPRNEDVDGDGYLDPVDEDFDGDGVLQTDIATYEPDIDGDRIFDPEEDLDGDGIPDRGEDVDGSGTLDTAEPDLNLDGVLDPNEDLDGDGFRDVDEDLDGDGILDKVEDLDGDGNLDVAEDIDGDGVLDGVVGSDALAEDEDGDGYLDDFTNRLPDTLIRYNFSGLIAERVDARGISFRYSYDGLDRLTRIQVGHYTPWATQEISDPIPVDFLVTQSYSEGYPSDHWIDTVTDREEVVRVDFTYGTTAGGLPLETITARTLVGSTYFDVSTVTREFDARGRVVYEDQKLGTAGPARRVSYGWDYQPTKMNEIGHHRLASIAYPGAVNEEKTLNFDFGTQGSLADTLSRRVGLDLSIDSVVTPLVDRAFTGSGRIAERDFGGGAIIQSFEETGVVGLPGLDNFGMPATIRFENANTDQLFDARYAYDVRGNIEWVEQGFEGAPSGSGGYPWEQDRLYQYDNFNRLIETSFGSLDELPAGGYDIDRTLEHRVDSWALDRVGNWTGSEAIADINGDDILDLADITAFVQAFSTGDDTADLVEPFGVLDLADISAFVSWYGEGTGIQPGRSVIRYDSTEAELDVRSYFDDVSGANQLDLSRLIHTSTTEPGGDTVNAAYEYDAAGNMTADGTYYYEYDAWGRLVQVYEAVDDPANPGTLIPADYAMRFYVYDGLGRLVRTRKLIDADPLPNYHVEEYVYDGIRRIQTYAGIEGGSPPPLDREYVWGDGGVDELICYFDHDFGGANADPDQPWFVINDALGDAVAVCDTTSSSATIAKSYFYEPYGDVTLAENHTAAPDLDVGHKGLFHDRLDADLTGSPSPSLVPYAHILYQNRNRVYVPARGRFLQKDPNGSAQAMLNGGYGGSVAAVSALAVGLDMMYVDGTNLYQYNRSNPVRYSDPLGLMSEDPFAIVDDFVAESTGARAAFLERIVGGTKTAAYVGATIASLLPFPITSTLADLGASALEGDMPPELIMARKVVGFASLAGLSRVVGKLGFTASKYAIKYVRQHGMRSMIGAGLKYSPVGLARKAADFVSRKYKKIRGTACGGCFAGGTLVWTSAGAMPIEEVQAGDPLVHVLAAPDELPIEATGAEWAWPTEVSETVEIGDAAITLVVVNYADGSAEVIESTDEHPFWVVGRGWTRVELLEPGDRLSSLDIGAEVSVQSVVFTDRRVAVYNLSIPTSPTFFVGHSGIWVHNCFEQFESLDDAIGFSVAQHGAKIVDRAPTKNPIHIADGFTETIYATDDYGVQWTVHRNPTTNKYRSSHPSSSNNDFSD